MAVVTIKSLLEAGVHFGHQTRRWNPKMKRYIFEERNGIYIIDLQQTLVRLSEACEFIRSVVRGGKSVLFVGTKRQAREAIEESAKRCGMHHVTQRWLGGTLTNNRTIRQSINRLREIDAMFEDGRAAGFKKKELSSLTRERHRLHRNLDGIGDMDQLPGAVFVIDTKRERIATHEAGKLDIPIIAVLDTNADPDEVNYPIPANDDAVKSIVLITSVLADVISETQAEMEKLGIVSKKPEARDKQEERRPPPRPRAHVKKRVVRKVIKKKAAAQPTVPKAAPAEPTPPADTAAPNKAEPAQAPQGKPEPTTTREGQQTDGD